MNVVQLFVHSKDLLLDVRSFIINSCSENVHEDFKICYKSPNKKKLVSKNRLQVALVPLYGTIFARQINEMESKKEKKKMTHKPGSFDRKINIVFNSFTKKVAKDLIFIFIYIKDPYENLHKNAV